MAKTALELEESYAAEIDDLWKKIHEEDKKIGPKHKKRLARINLLNRKIFLLINREPSAA